MDTRLTFRTVNLAASVICAALSAALLAAPDIVWWMFGIAGSPEADFVGRRAAMLFLGFAVLCWKAAPLTNAEAQCAISAALMIAMAGLALAGSVEFIRGFSGPGILLAVSTETLFSMLYFRHWNRRRNDPSPGA